MSHRAVSSTRLMRLADVARLVDGLNRIGEPDAALHVVEKGGVSDGLRCDPLQRLVADGAKHDVTGEVGLGVCDPRSD